MCLGNTCRPYTSKVFYCSHQRLFLRHRTIPAAHHVRVAELLGVASSDKGRAFGNREVLDSKFCVMPLIDVPTAEVRVEAGKVEGAGTLALKELQFLAALIDLPIG